jgi:predicted DNA-binding transcriptional regulator AlpA
MNSPAADLLEKELLTVEDLAVILDISPRTVFRLRAKRALPDPVEISTNIVRWRSRDIRSYLDRLRPRRPRYRSGIL